MIRFDANDSCFALLSRRSVAAILRREGDGISTGAVMGAAMGAAMGDVMGDTMGIIMGIVADSEASNEIGFPFEIGGDIMYS